METLARERCVACDRNAPRLSDDEIKTMLPQVPEWSVIEVDGIPRLQRSFKVTDFAAALDLANRVGALADAEEHHPAILIEWGRVTVSWWTHKIRGLHRNDMVMAARTDQIVGV